MGRAVWSHFSLSASAVDGRRDAVSPRSSLQTVKHHLTSRGEQTVTGFCFEERIRELSYERRLADFKKANLISKGLKSALMTYYTWVNLS